MTAREDKIAFLRALIELSGAVASLQSMIVALQHDNIEVFNSASHTVGEEISNTQNIIQKLIDGLTVDG